ncbi:beta-N-acetylglucosaminidase domain-containing protein [Streptomyces sp. NPDC050504]|uniref:beta-N-acetylglucosaminidase domain-containing protein n=1 Tax=Streptomyces sp. NPDC050504 TaxID=3365618 RepID=UPI0037B3744C
MRLGHGKRAAAVAAAVVGGLLGPVAPGASAAPGAPPGPDGAPPRAAAAAPRTAAAPPAVWPRPQSLTSAGRAVPLTSEVTLDVAPGADPYAVAVVRDVLRGAGVRTVHTRLPGRGPLVAVGGPRADAALRALRAAGLGDLPSGGYRLAAGPVAGRATVAFDGTGPDGLFHAAQTLRRLVGDGRAVPGVLVRDWPGSAVRGMTEGFYGRPWTHRQRLAQLDFMGRTKQNRYLYAAGDDPYRQARWRDPYPAAQRADFRALAGRARANHVTLAWAVAPGQSMCLASDGDVEALKRKVDAMWALGVRAFQLQFQDVSYSEWHCGKDSDTFGRGPRAAARAQARVANALDRHLAERHPQAGPLSLMPTEYYQDGDTEYRAKLADELDARVQVAWTGVGVVPRTITGRELARTRDTFEHPLVTMDNYPVNDWAQDRLFLGPYTGRQPAVAIGSAALLANAMEQPAASRVALFTTADYAWNPRDYRPGESWRAALDDLADGDAAAREALGVLAGNGASSVLGGAESAYLRPLVAEFWQSRTGPDAAARDRAARALRAAFTAMRLAPDRLATPADGQLADEVRPWSDQLARYGRAGELAVDLLQAQARGEGSAAWRASLALEPLRAAAKESRATVGKGVLGPFLDRVRAEADAWTGAAHRTGLASREPDRFTLRLDRPRPLDAVTVMTGPDPDPTAAERPGAVLQAHVPGAGWRPLGPLSPTGWTQVAARGLRADALRVAWPASDTARQVHGTARQVHGVVPWYGDGPAARFDLARAELDAEIGGAPQRAQARLAASRPGEVRGALTAKAPAGIRVAVPKRTTVPRGSLRTDVPVEVSVPAGTPAGTYEVPLVFAGEERVLTVRAYPRTSGADLVRGAAVSSSGDETADFPAPAAADGDPATRWSSPAADGQWWQAELTEPVRLGQVVLRWQEAYAAKYRVQVSSDGGAWRTAATVRDGRGGREAVRMDAKDVRYVRVRGDERATRFGYSLWSVEAYAVAPAAPEKGAPKKEAPKAPGKGAPEKSGPGSPPQDSPDQGSPALPDLPDDAPDKQKPGS